jgi:hypothetical protein
MKSYTHTHTHIYIYPTYVIYGEQVSMTTIGSTPREEKWASHNLLSTNRNDKINPEIYIYIRKTLIQEGGTEPRKATILRGTVRA